LTPGAETWSAPRTIVSTPLLLENWADFASLCVGTDGALTAQWFQVSAPDARGYDGWFARSSDGGATWTKPARLGHEFVALAPLSGGRTLAVWLESARAPRDPAAPRVKRDPSAAPSEHKKDEPYQPSMRLVSRVLAPDGSTLGDWTIDPDVCTCCQNTVRTLPDGKVFVAYRGHNADELRDNKYAIFSGTAWSTPQTLKDDLWKIPACPVNGPAVDAKEGNLAVAWFTAANGVPRVQARYSRDAAKTFGETAQVDLGRPMGRIELVMLRDASALIVWMEIGSKENVAGIYARRLFPDGSLSAAQLLSESSQARASGFPRGALRPDGEVILSWTKTGDQNQVQVMAIDPRSFRPQLGKEARVSTPAASAVPLELCVAVLDHS
jgi:hypothetical protein